MVELPTTVDRFKHLVLSKVSKGKSKTMDVYLEKDKGNDRIKNRLGTSYS